MRFELTASFKADYRRLSQREQELFKEAVRLFSDSCDKFVDTGDLGAWRSSLRVKAIVGGHGIFEMTWNFSGPDGRATWEWCTVEVEGKKHPAVRWRRVGGHSIFGDP
ncbi:MAG: hypothetical protein M0Z92_11105 [Actinomycetota bacterium]|nr:hypothetical protein [Actinomycetota bacterium]